MKQLIKQTSHFPGENVHPERAFQNSPICFYHLIGLPYFRFFIEFSIPEKANRKVISVGFFLLHTHLKITT
jgi:hypothetical protein